MLLLSMLSACKVVDAPENLEALMVFGFVNFNEDDKFLEETAESLLPLIETNQADLEDGYRVNDLTRADLEAGGVPDPVGDGIVGAMGFVSYVHGVPKVVDAVSRENKDQMFPENFLEYDVLASSDRPCFLSSECDRLDQTVFERTKVALLGEAERTYDAEYRWITTESVGDAVFIRQIAPEPMEFEGVLNAVVHQQYSLVMLYRQGNKARRIEAFWVDADVAGLDVPDNFAVNEAVKQMSSQAERIDDWIDANE